MSCVGGPERRETFPENLLELPCTIRSFSALREGNRHVLVFLLVPKKPVAAWVNKETLIIAEQSATDDKFKGFLKSSIVSEDERDYTVEIMDRDRLRTIIVPKDWLTKETVRFQTDKVE